MKKIYLLISFAVFSLSLRAQPCSDLFISEYIEGTSFNKAIEIFNPTSGTILLDGYLLQTYSNGSDTPSFHLYLHGTLAPNDVYVIAHSQSDASLLSIADTTSLVCNWNGDDAVALINTFNGDTLDVIGVIGQDPGTSWPVDTGSTLDHDLVRIPSVEEGTTNWSLSATQWIAYGESDYSHLGSHDMIPCAINPELFFMENTLSVSESDGSFSTQVGISNPNNNQTDVDITAMDITAENGSDYMMPVSQTISFPANSSTPVTVSGTIINDLISEPDEVFQLQLSNATNQAIITADVIKITIIDDDGLSTGSDLNGSSVKIFPTISSGIFTVAFSSNVSITVNDLCGNEVLRKSCDQQILKLDLQDIARGIYFIHVKNDDVNLVKKVIIQ